jgi:hypothetical protein
MNLVSARGASRLTLLATYYEGDHINPLNAKLNPICHLMALLGAHRILHVSRIRVNKDEMWHGR